MLVLRSNDQIRELAVMVETHGSNAEDVANRTLDNGLLLKQCRQSLATAQNLQNGFASDIDCLKRALSILENPNEDPANALKALEGWGALVVREKFFPRDSLARNGIVRESNDLIGELLTAEETQQVRKHINRPIFERLKWTKGDYLACAACIVAGLAIEIINCAWRYRSPIDPDGHVSKWFNQQFHEGRHATNNPIDNQGLGFGGSFHRARSRGHDLARFFDAVDQTASGEFKGTQWSYGTPYEVVTCINQFGNAYPTMPWTAAFVNVAVHLFADFFSTHALPMPLTSVVYENAEREMRKFVHDLYSGGFYLRHCSMGLIQILLSNLAIETWLWMQHGSEALKEGSVSLKRYEMRASVTGILSGANIAGCALFENPFLLNVPILISTLDSSVKILQLKAMQHSWTHKEVRNLQELAQQWESLTAEVRNSSKAP